MAVAKQADVLSLLAGKRELPQCILVYGADRGAVYDLCQSIIRKLSRPGETLDVVRLTEAQVSSSKDRLYSEFAARSMFGDGQLVWVSATGDGIVKSLEPLLESKEAGNLILIDSESLAKSSKLRKLCESDARSLSVAVYEETAHELRSRLERTIRGAGFTIGDDALERLLELVSREKGVGDSEVNKLLLYVHGQKSISLDDVVAVCGDTHDSSTDEVLDAVFEGRMADVERHVVALQGQGSAFKAVLPLALQHIAKLQAMSVQMRQGQSSSDVLGAPRNGIFFKRRASFGRQLQIWSLESLLDANQKLADAVHATRLTPELEDDFVSRTLLALSWQARSLAA